MFARNINMSSAHVNVAVIVLPDLLIIFIPGLMEHLGFLGAFFDFLRLFMI